ncbi:MAG: hypothetical protein AAGB15_02045 [Pseudomonadota bacterium]
MDDFADDIDTAAPLPQSGTVSGTIEVAGDVDVFAIDLAAGERILAEIPIVSSMTTPSLGLPEIRVVAQSLDDVLVTNRNNLPGNNDVRSQSLSFTAPEAGTYFVAVSGSLATNGSITTGDYQLNVSRLGSAQPDLTITEADLEARVVNGFNGPELTLTGNVTFSNQGAGLFAGDVDWTTVLFDADTNEVLATQTIGSVAGLQLQSGGTFAGSVFLAYQAAIEPDQRFFASVTATTTGEADEFTQNNTFQTLVFDSTGRFEPAPVPDNGRMRGTDEADVFVLGADGKRGTILDFDIDVDLIDVSGWGARNLNDIQIRDLRDADGRVRWVQISDGAGPTEVLVRFAGEREGLSGAFLGSSEFIFTGGRGAIGSIIDFNPTVVVDSAEQSEFDALARREVFELADDNQRDLLRGFDTQADILDVSTYRRVGVGRHGPRRSDDPRSGASQRHCLVGRNRRWERRRSVGALRCCAVHDRCRAGRGPVHFRRSIGPAAAGPAHRCGGYGWLRHHQWPGLS